MTKTKWFLIFLAVGVLLRVVYLTAQEPFFYKSSNGEKMVINLNHDENAHWNYVQVVRQTNDLPRFAEAKGMSDKKMQESNNLVAYTYENYHQPAYYVLMALLAFDNPQVCRIWNVCLFLSGVLLLWSLTRNNYVFAFLMLAPSAIQTSVVISNDVLMFSVTCLTVYAMVRQKVILYGLGIILCALAKTQGIAIAAVLGLWYLFVEKQPRLAGLSFLAFVFGIIAFIDRYEYSIVNGYTFSALYDPWNIIIAMMSQILMITGDQVAFASHVILPPQVIFMVFGAWLVYGGFLSFKRKRWSAYTAASGAVFATWFLFSFTHAQWPDRLLFPMIPFLAANYEVYT